MARVAHRAWLRALADRWAGQVVHSKLGDMHACNKNFTQALAHYHHALSLNPSLKAAQDGLERIEAMIRACDKGLDPDLATSYPLQVMQADGESDEY